MKKPLIIRSENSIVISLNGKRLVVPIDKCKGMTDDEIANSFIKKRNMKNNRV